MTEKQITTEKDKKKKNETSPDVFITFVVLLFFGFIFSLPCLCRVGAIKSDYLFILYFLMMAKLGWDYFRGKLCYLNITICALIFTALWWLIELYPYYFIILHDLITD